MTAIAAMTVFGAAVANAMDKSRADFEAILDAYAEARHKHGAHVYNAATAQARQAVLAALDAREQASRKQALEEASEEADGFYFSYMDQANGGDSSGASDHRADAAIQIADAIRSLEGNATEETT